MNVAAPRFLRDATGLVKEATAFDIFQFNTVSVCGAQMVPPWILLVPFIGAPLGATFLMVTVGALAIGAMYYILAISMPRSGGDYVFGSRLLHPLAGIFAGVMSGVLLGIVNGAWGATTWVPVGLSPLFTYLGAVWNNQSLLTMATTVTNPIYYGTLAVIVTVGFAALLILGGMRKYFVVQNVLCVLSIITQFVIIGVLAVTDRNTFTQALNSFLTTFSLGHDQIISTAQSLGWTSPAAVSLALALQAGPAVYGSMFWVEFSTSLGGEIKQVRRSQLIGIVGCLLFWTVLTYVTFFLMVNMVGYEFISAHDYLILAAPQGLGSLPAVPPYLLYVMVAGRNPLLATLVAIGLIAGTIPTVAWALILFSRSIFAMSFDRVLPSTLGEVSDRFHTPIKTLVIGAFIMLVWVVATILPQAASFASYFGVAQGFLLVITFIVIGLGAMLFPYIRKELYETACPQVLRRKILGLPVISLLGLIVFIYNLQDAYFLMDFPQYYGITPIFLGTLVGAGIFAVGAYFVAKAYRKKQGLDIAYLFKTLPPE
ncbi:MAG TPA: amino acid permease [Candidatus Acidoferrum sp.]|nr:amino acid permease [Candidatus Acidoferrum sp.]